MQKLIQIEKNITILDLFFAKNGIYFVPKVGFILCQKWDFIFFIWISAKAEVDKSNSFGQFILIRKRHR